VSGVFFLLYWWLLLVEDERARRDREREGEKRQGGSEDEGEWVLLSGVGGVGLQICGAWFMP